MAGIVPPSVTPPERPKPGVAADIPPPTAPVSEAHPEVAPLSAAPPPSWSCRTVTPVPADGAGQKAPRTPDDDVAETMPDRQRREQLGE